MGDFWDAGSSWLTGLFFPIVYVILSMCMILSTMGKNQSAALSSLPLQGLDDVILLHARVEYEPTLKGRYTIAQAKADIFRAGGRLIRWWPWHCLPQSPVKRTNLWVASMKLGPDGTSTTGWHKKLKRTSDTVRYEILELLNKGPKGNIMMKVASIMYEVFSWLCARWQLFSVKIKMS